jgi:hypothetical protein
LPQRWGQSVSSQDTLDAKRFGNLAAAATAASAGQRTSLRSHPRYHVKKLHPGTGKRNRQGDAKTLTFFAIGNNKPAFGIEGSKNVPGHAHLLPPALLESFPTPSA